MPTPVIPLLLLLLCSIISCKSKDGFTLEHEEDTPIFSGYIIDCASGQPIEGKTIQIDAVKPGMLLGNREILGISTTRSDGYYKINPKHLTFRPEYYTITVDDTDKYASHIYQQIKPADMHINAGVFNYNIPIRRSAVIRINIGKLTPTDTSLKVIVNGYQKNTQCIEYSNNADSFFTNIYDWHDIVYRRVRANDYLRIGKQRIQNGDTAIEQFTEVFVPFGDTVVVDITY